jgi:hypothetical protein
VSIASALRLAIVGGLLLVALAVTAMSQPPHWFDGCARRAAMGVSCR